VFISEDGGANAKKWSELWITMWLVSVIDILTFKINRRKIIVLY